MVQYDVHALARLATIIDVPDITLDEPERGRFTSLEHVVDVIARSRGQIVEAHDALSEIE